MKSVGQLLNSARRKQKISIAQVVRDTRIRKDYVIALESDDYNQLPSAVYIRGFIKNYAEYLDLPPDTLLAVFRRDFAVSEKGEIIHRSIIENESQSNWWRWTPKLTIATATGFLIAIFIAILVYQYTGILKPRLNIITPENNALVMSRVIRVSGTTDPSVVLTVNQQLIIVQSNGQFEASIELPPNSNQLIFEATNSRNHTTQEIRTVNIITDSPADSPDTSF